MQFFKDRGKMQTRILSKKTGKMRNQSPPPASEKGSWRNTFHILLVEPMFVLVCLASLPGAPRRALDAAGLVLVWCGFFAMAMTMQLQTDRIHLKRQRKDA